MPILRRCLIALTILFFALPPAQAQQAAGPAIALQGMDVVSYFNGGPVPGQAMLAHDFDGARYLFSSAENRAAFVADPDRYLPQFGGLCTTGLSKGFIGQGDPNLWSIVGGRLFLFSIPGHREAVGQEAAISARATHVWANNRPAIP